MTKIMMARNQVKRKKIWRKGKLIDELRIMNKRKRDEGLSHKERKKRKGKEKVRKKSDINEEKT